MHNLGTEGFVVIQVVPPRETSFHRHPNDKKPKLRIFGSTKLFNGFRKIVMRLVLSIPITSCSGKAKQKNSEWFEPPKTSCSSYYSSHSHYNEAIADCIEFFKSSQDEPRKSDAML